MALTAEQEQIAKSVVETYEECTKLLEYVDTLTPQEIMDKVMLNSLVALPLLGLVKTFVSFTELVNKVQRLGGVPTAMESKLVIDLASTVCNIFNQIEAKVEEIESKADADRDNDPDLLTSIGPSGNLH